jgi:Tfp pilus assembly protein PilO
MAWYNPSDPKQRNWMLGGLAFFIAIIPFRMYLLAPRQLELDGMQTRLESIETQNRTAAVLSAQGGGDLEERMLAYERHVAKLEELIPEAEEVAGLLDEISRVSRVRDVESISLVPEPAETGAFYVKSSYDMTVVGEYHSVAGFLTDIASLSRIVTPVELDVRVYDQPERFPDMVSPIAATFRIETYVLPDASAPAPAEVPGG